MKRIEPAQQDGGQAHITLINADFIFLVERVECVPESATRNERLKHVSE
ncbi:MAG: hypothetical protein M1495_06020 [Bacteroidetes bacterium]|nr:hypothetical protein [Bacteroidota bacterium]